MSSEQNASNPNSENPPHLSSAPASSAEPQQETQSDKDNHGLNPLERARLFEAAGGAKEVAYCKWSRVLWHKCAFFGDFLRVYVQSI